MDGASEVALVPVSGAAIQGPHNDTIGTCNLARARSPHASDDWIQWLMAPSGFEGDGDAA